MHARMTRLIVAATVVAVAVGFTYGEEDAVDAAIAEHRMGELIIRTAPGAKVKVTQLRHEFWFGTALSQRMLADGADPEARRRYLEIVKANFNAAVHENALKWYATERRQDQVTYAAADRMLAWCDANNIALRGHCLMWCVDRYVQDWIKQLSDDQLSARVRKRIQDVVTRYRGRIGEYDVNNEMLHGDYYAKRLGAGVRADMFTWAREADPKAVLYVNDYSVLSNPKEAKRYEDQIESLLAAGAPVGGIGVQGHFGGRWPPDPRKIAAALDRLGRFGLPIKVTEFDMNSDDEQVKAKALSDVYRTCFAHPAVNGILMWGFWGGAHWRPNAALWRQDFTPTPAAETYRELVFNQWWTRVERQADAEGVCRVKAFYGRHRVEVDGRSLEVDLPKSKGEITVDTVE